MLGAWYGAARTGPVRAKYGPARASTLPFLARTSPYHARTCPRTGMFMGYLLIYYYQFSMVCFSMLHGGLVHYSLTGVYVFILVVLSELLVCMND